MDRRDIGRRYERRAAWRLRLRGWRIIAQGWTCPGGELDIVAVRWKTLLFVEVRQRSAGGALASIDTPKMDRTLKAARSFIHRYGLERYTVRYDLIAYEAEDHCRHIKNVLAPR